MKTKLEQILKVAKGFDFFGAKGCKGFCWELYGYNFISTKIASFADEKDGFVEQDYSLNDLMFSPDSNLIEAIYGSEEVCRECLSVEYLIKEPTYASYCEQCSVAEYQASYTVYAMPAHLYHKSELAKLSTDEARLDYILEGIDEIK